MYILGISCYYHDASAALIRDGKIVAAAQEERFSRIKHDMSFPINAVNFCLKSLNITANDLDYIGFYEKPLIKFERILFQHLSFFPLTYKTFLKTMPSWINQKLRIITNIKKNLEYKGDILFIQHHLSHAASCFFVSPFEKAAIVTIDGVGEWTTTSYGKGINNQINLLQEIKFPSSLGLLYSAITAFLGFKVNNSEYKIMGLSSYGNKNKKSNPYYNYLKKAIKIKKDGSFKLDLKYFKFHYSDKMFSKKLCDLLKTKPRNPNRPLSRHHKDIAAALQMIYEDVFFKILNHVYEKTLCSNLSLAGGCALNSVANGKIIRKSPFKKIWIQPAAGDGGASLGVAYFIYNSILNHKRNYVQDTCFFGPEFSTGQVHEFLDKNKIHYSKFKNKNELLKKTAELIYDNNIVAWFQGKMEWGPRALGSRSILANPLNPEAKDILNNKVKHRESFRPFAPVVCKEDAAEYFECDEPLPNPADFMLMVYPIKKKIQKILPSVTHVDGTGRLQSVSRKSNPLFYDLLREFEKLSGIPILINTSFNIRGEPIVCTPYDAYRCMMGTGIDYLIIENFLVKREDNLQDKW
ncbi:hypothetical protein GF327_04320 [Candidatus Woesearchaeota archaeon]|nr:hypothetical protein [Candidatus Woesearchaeota archaeon]